MGMLDGFGGGGEEDEEMSKTAVEVVMMETRRLMNADGDLHRSEKEFRGLGPVAWALLRADEGARMCAGGAGWGVVQGGQACGASRG